jgi:hypothetical protein
MKVILLAAMLVAFTSSAHAYTTCTYVGPSLVCSEFGSNRTPTVINRYGSTYSISGGESRQLRSPPPKPLRLPPPPTPDLNWNGQPCPPNTQLVEHRGEQIVCQ